MFWSVEDCDLTFSLGIFFVIVVLSLSLIVSLSLLLYCSLSLSLSMVAATVVSAKVPLSVADCNYAFSLWLPLAIVVRDAPL